MLYISTENIKYSTVGATFTVTFHTPIDELGYLQAIHDKYAEMNMKAFSLTAHPITVQTDCPKTCPSIDICTKNDTDCPWK